ncbi:MAG: MerR family transcriptional regulator [Armatimonadota bacterium]
MDRDRGEPLYAISVAAQQVGLSARTLRIYEEEGLIRPARKSGDQRLYSDQDLVWIRCISELIHGHSLTTAGIRRLLDLIPCWEIKHCPAEISSGCAPFLNIPDMAVRAPTGKAGAVSPAQAPVPTGQDAKVLPYAEAAAAQPQAEAGPVEIKIFYGLKEFGVVFPCLKCIQAERIARRIAERYPGRVSVRKHDILSAEADRLGVMMTPTVVVDGEVVASGKGLSANRLEQLIEGHLAEEAKK